MNNFSFLLKKTETHPVNKMFQGHFSSSEVKSGLQLNVLFVQQLHHGSLLCARHQTWQGRCRAEQDKRSSFFMKCAAHERRCTPNERPILSHYTVTSCDVWKAELSPLRGEHTGTRLRSGGLCKEDAIKWEQEGVQLHSSTIHFAALHSGQLGMTIWQ